MNQRPNENMEVYIVKAMKYNFTDAGEVKTHLFKVICYNPEQAMHKVILHLQDSQPHPVYKECDTYNEISEEYWEVYPGEDVKKITLIN